MPLDKLIKMSKVVVEPYLWAIGILSVLLLLSVCGNVYQATRSYDITIEQQNAESDYSINGAIK